MANSEIDTDREKSAIIRMRDPGRVPLLAKIAAELATNITDVRAMFDDGTLKKMNSARKSTTISNVPPTAILLLALRAPLDLMVEFSLIVLCNFTRALVYRSYDSLWTACLKAGPLMRDKASITSSRWTRLELKYPTMRWSSRQSFILASKAGWASNSYRRISVARVTWSSFALPGDYASADLICATRLTLLRILAQILVHNMDFEPEDSGLGSSLTGNSQDRRWNCRTALSDWPPPKCHRSAKGANAPLVRAQPLHPPLTPRITVTRPLTLRCDHCGTVSWQASTRSPRTVKLSNSVVGGCAIASIDTENPLVGGIRATILRIADYL
jgi:hypothetical protein